MSAKIISGTELRAEILEEIALEVKELKNGFGRPPGLVTILAGEDPASISYVTNKIRTAKRIGFKEVQENLSSDVTEQRLLDMIRAYNSDDTIDGILVQLPLPEQIDENKVIMAVDPDKDVDGFHPVNVGRLVIGGDAVRFPPCTPAGIIEMIVRSGVQTSGAEVVVVGRSNIVGKPVACMMMQKMHGGNATVTVVHTATRDSAAHCRRADILIVAAGVPGLVRAEWIKPGACVIDVGVNRIGTRVDRETGREKVLLQGDVDFDEASRVAGYITPVPGGVGPMTIAMLMRNTVNSMKFRLGQTRQGTP